MAEKSELERKNKMLTENQTLQNKISFMRELKRPVKTYFLSKTSFFWEHSILKPKLSIDGQFELENKNFSKTKRKVSTENPKKKIISTGDLQEKLLLLLLAETFFLITSVMSS